MIPKHIDAIERADLERLRENQVSEGKSIEYKRELPGASDQDRVRFLRAVSSMANLGGGDVLYGVEEQNGVPSAFPGVDVPDWDALKLRLENSLRDNLQPRLREVHFKLIPVDGPHFVVVIRTPRSWSGPHRVDLGSNTHFYSRNSAGAYPMDTEQLRTAFTETILLEERIRQFRSQRLETIRQHKAVAVPLENGARFVMHIVPISAAASRPSISLQQMVNALGDLTPISLGGGYEHRSTLDGLLIHSPVHAGTTDSYSLTFRSGALEIVDIYAPDEDGNALLSLDYVEGHVSTRLSSYIETLSRLGAAFPMYVFFSYLGIGEYKIWMRQGHNPSPGHRADRPDLELPEVVVEAVPFESCPLLKPVFDMTWNAFDYRRGTPNIDAAGAWVGPRQ